MSWLPLALATAAAFGLYNLFMKLAAERMDQVLGAAVLQLVAATLGGALALGLRAAGRPLTFTSAGLARACVAGLAVGAAEILAFIVFSRGAPVALAGPVVMGGSVVVTAVLGAVFLRESLAAPQLAGVALVTAGVALISVGGR